jgi:hypothetical protein
MEKEEIHLMPWQEVVGIFVNITKTQIETIITLKTRNKRIDILIPLDMSDFSVVNHLKNKQVSILRTDNAFLFREINTTDTP